MSQQTSSHRFQRKLKAMTNRADHWQQDPEIAEWPRLSELLKEFSDFANAYISLLKKIPKSISRHPFVLNTGVEQLLQEWSILSRACEQRHGPAKGATDKDSFQYNLREAGKLAKNYCDRWHPEELKNEPYLKLHEPIVYFEKLYRISRAVYAPETPVLSIPLTDYNDRTRWQALAHELGHHIYWNGVDLETSEVVHERLHDAIAEALSASPFALDSEALGRRARLWEHWADRARLWGRWLEEIFADVCGTLLAGPAYAMSAQDTAADRIEKIADLTIDDHEHPCSYLRPLIALQVLREITSHSSTFTSLKTALTEEKGMFERLEDRWMEFCQGASVLPHTETRLKMENLATDIPSVVQAILHEPVWPHGKSLWDLIEPYGTEPRYLEALTQMEVTPLSPIFEWKPAVIKKNPRLKKTDPDSFRRLWQDLYNRVEKAELEKKQKPLAFWLMLLELGLSETHFHDTLHQDCAKHWLFGRWHRHDPETGEPIYDC
jgi:hypothetical protein